jgi:5-methyltetrahydropteroyltriglutamate--homocysteine methyltransferase
MTFRVDFVGSFLRPEALKNAFAAYEAGTLADAGLRAAQDVAVTDLIAQQGAHGLPLANDGEYRRRQFMESIGGVAGFEPWLEAMRSNAARDNRPAEKQQKNDERRPVTQRLELVKNSVLDEYRFGSACAAVPVKVTLVGADRIMQRYAYEQSRDIYPTLDEFMADVVRIERQILTELYAAGCSYVQIDAPGYTAYVDEPSRQAMRDRGEDPDANIKRSLAADAAIANGVPGLTLGIHLCRGNARRAWHREGSYDAIAEQMFNELPHQRYLLEYDDERSGGFEPLRFVPKGKIVVLGLITSRSPQMETRDALRARIDEAAKFIPLEQLALSPQCGFASSIAGNPLTEDDQWRKIDLMLQVAEDVWGIRRLQADVT